jgi:hypothetical protein
MSYPSPLVPHRQLIAEQMEPVLATVREALKKQGITDDTPLSLALETVTKLHLAECGRGPTLERLEALVREITLDNLSTSLATDG